MALKAQVLIPGLGRHQTLTPGTLIYDFRGDTHEFIEATRAPELGRSGKLSVRTPGRGDSVREYYCEVFPGVSITEDRICTCGHNEVSHMFYREDCTQVGCNCGRWNPED